MMIIKSFHLIKSNCLPLETNERADLTRARTHAARNVVVYRILFERSLIAHVNVLFQDVGGLYFSLVFTNAPLHRNQPLLFALSDRIILCSKH